MKDLSKIYPAGTPIFWIDPAQNVIHGTSAGRESNLVVLETEMLFQHRGVAVTIRRRRRVHARFCGLDWRP